MLSNICIHLVVFYYEQEELLLVHVFIFSSEVLQSQNGSESQNEWGLYRGNGIRVWK